MLRAAAVLSLALVTACAGLGPDTANRRTPLDIDLPPMNTFAAPQVSAPTRSNASIARDILSLTFQLESGRILPRMSRFEGPITVAVRGSAPASLNPDLDRLIARLRREAGIDISRAAPGDAAGVVIELVPRRELQRAVPQAACFVVPRMSSWSEFRQNRRSSKLDWTTLRLRESMAIFLPGDVSPQEVRDCLHEELAQAIGPLNDLYHLTDSVFNDDNFHTVLTGFDMLVLRALYAPELKSGMTRDQVAARLPGILDRLNPEGRRARDRMVVLTTRDWIGAIETALGPRTPAPRRSAAARDAVQIAEANGWDDTRLAFSLYAYGRLSLGNAPEASLAAFFRAAEIYRSTPSTELQAAHVAMQLSAFALSSGQSDLALRIVNEALPPVARAENAALLGMLLMVKAEALELEGRFSEAREVRREALGWARYGFGSDREVRERLREISALAPDAKAAEEGT